MPPRSARKPKVDRSRNKTTIKETTPTKLELDSDAAHPHGVISAEWNKMTYQEDVDEAVGELMDEFLAKVMDSCYDVYFGHQLAPFSTAWAKSYITQTLEHQVTYAEDLETTQSFLTEDSEPFPSTTDSWSQGCVPIVPATPPPILSTDEEADIEVSPVQSKARVKMLKKVVPSKQDKEERGIKKGLLRPHSPLKTSSTKNQHVKASKSDSRKNPPSKSTASNKLEESTDVKQSLNKQKTSLNQNKGKPIPKLDPLSLPRHWESPQYEIVEKKMPQPQPKRPSGSLYKLLKSPLSLSSSKEHPGKFRKTNEDIPLSEQGVEQHMSDLPVKLDAMILAEGVSLRNPQDVEMKTLQSDHPSQSSQLKLMNRFPPNPTFSVNQVTVGPAPRVVLLPQSKE